MQVHLDGFPLPIKKLKGTDPVASLDLSRKSLSPASVVVIAALIGDNPSITYVGKDGLNLEGNQLGDEGWGAIFAAVCSSTVSKITSIDASFEGIGPEGAKLIGQALRNSVNPSVTSVRAFRSS